MPSFFDRFLRDRGAVHPDELATVVVASVEGAIAMCRARRDMGPLDRVARQLETIITAALADREGPSGVSATTP
ncbi:hypothetical protein ABZX77_33485 [Streptomyces sp. NPDC004237]|uniref:LmrA/YxaF family transcription factor n=1 Tax=Streptomyces sp. NPDC004237 TaxID=3154455 RepID=UPI0033BF3900